MPKNYINHIGTYNDHSKSITINGANTNVADLIRTFMQDEPTKEDIQPEDIAPLDTSFFGTDRFTADICQKNLTEAIEYATGKADACRRIMLADTCGYIHIRQFSDARKAELINQFSAPKYVFTDDDFCKARNRMNTK